MARLEKPEIPRVKYRYRHMMREDTAIWRRFLEAGQFIPDAVWYDVKVGTPIDIDVDQPEWLIKVAKQITTKRIDVVGLVGMSYWIIELKPNASYNAMGQVIYYAYEFQKSFGKSLEVLPVIITDQVDKDILPICDEVGILVVEVGKIGI